MKKIAVQTYSMKSTGARALVAALKDAGANATITSRDQVPVNQDMVINWGWSGGIVYPGMLTLNPGWKISKVINKLEFFRQVNGQPWCIPFTELGGAAARWIEQGHVVYCRTHLASSAGEGIVVARNVRELVPSRLYTKKITPHKREFRIQVLRDVVISELEKKPRAEEQQHPDIWTDANGWYYKKDIVVPACVRQAACEAIKVVDIDFGGVDVIYDGDKAWVLEINTAPGLKERSASLYAKAFVDLLENRR